MCRARGSAGAAAALFSLGGDACGPRSGESARRTGDRLPADRIRALPPLGTASADGGDRVAAVGRRRPVTLGRRALLGRLNAIGGKAKGIGCWSFVIGYLSLAIGYCQFPNSQRPIINRIFIRTLDLGVGKDVVPSMGSQGRPPVRSIDSASSTTSESRPAFFKDNTAASMSYSTRFSSMRPSSMMA